MPTDVKSNPRVIIPRPRDTKYEKDMNVRRVMEEKEVLSYLQMQVDNCNLTPSEKRGMEKLAKRIKAKEITVYPTDKSSKLAVCSFASYEAQGAVHTKGDKVVSWEDINKAQRTVKGHLFTLNNVFNTGKELGKSLKLEQEKQSK